MRHVSLTCRNHPELRWSCKEIAFSDRGGYNGARNIFFSGKTKGKMHEDYSGVACEPAMECKCSASDLIRADDDALIHIQVQIDGVWTHVPQSWAKEEVE